MSPAIYVLSYKVYTKTIVLTVVAITPMNKHSLPLICTFHGELFLEYLTWHVVAFIQEKLV